MSTTLSHSGLPAGFGRFDLLRLFEQVVRLGFGLSSTAVALVRLYVLRTMDGDYLAGRICSVWTAGINLPPLVERFAEMQVKGEALALRARAIQQCRAEIRQLSQRIRDAGDEALRERARAILPDGRTARISSIDCLAAIREGLSAMLDELNSVPEPDRRAPKTSGAPEGTCARNIQDKNSSRRRTAQPGLSLERIRPSAALAVASDEYRDLAELLSGPTWPNLAEGAWRSCGRLGVAQNTWGRACQQFGREKAALIVLLIDRNAELPVGDRYRVRSPARCLAGMIRNPDKASMNLAGLFRATERRTQQSPLAASRPSQGREPAQGALAELTGRIMADVARGLTVVARGRSPNGENVHDISCPQPDDLTSLLANI